MKAYKYPLDYFQKRAIRAMNADKNVMACVATGSGKSTLADYAIALSLSRGKRIIMTSPIKALSNQKYKEFRDAFGVDAVGLMTGDIKFNPDAPCIVMTAEILRNLLYKRGSCTAGIGATAQLSLDGVDTVIMDEVHYINDPHRGKVWEETLTLLPREVKLVLLSATIDRPELLASWMGDLKQRDIHLINNHHRIIPLTHYLYKPTPYSDLANPQLCTGALIPLMTNDGEWRGKAYHGWAKEYNRIIHADDRRLPKDSVEYKRAVQREFSGAHRLNNLCEYLKYCQLHPAIFFVFSRKGCETYASSIVDSAVSGKMSAEIESTFDFYTHPYRKQLLQLPQYHTLRSLLLSGVAYHHSGLVPILKEVVEILFSKGFIKFLFATETFSVGLNMPTKTVVFLEYRKPCDAPEAPEAHDAPSRRMLKTDEYLQMAGRAGRRGIDDRGYVIYMPIRDASPESEGDLREMMSGKKQAVKSKMEWGFDFIFKCLHSSAHRWIDVVRDSYWYVELMREKAVLETELCQARSRVRTINNGEFLTAEMCEELKERHRLETLRREHTKVPKDPKVPKDWQRSLDTWKNSHIGKRWDTAYAEWREMESLGVRITELEAQIADMMDMNLFMGGYASYLKDVGFLDYPTTDFTDFTQLSASHLTTKGILATEVNEGDCLLMPELYLWASRISCISPEEVLATLSLFVEDVVGAVGDAVGDVVGDALTAIQSKPAVQLLERTREHLYERADVYGVTVSLRLNYPMYVVIQEWMSGAPVADITAKYNMYEGNLTRIILKMTNLLEEWRNMATYCSDVEMLRRMDGAEALLLREVVLPDSLYVRMRA